MPQEREINNSNQDKVKYGTNPAELPEGAYEGKDIQDLDYVKNTDTEEARKSKEQYNPMTNYRADLERPQDPNADVQNDPQKQPHTQPWGQVNEQGIDEKGKKWKRKEVNLELYIKGLLAQNRNTFSVRAAIAHGGTTTLSIAPVPPDGSSHDFELNGNGIQAAEWDAA